ncbi:MAG: hypothetical protein FWF86_08380 [Clostridia bacterium]|nr:hypothetical protein [Clostridia bacterium]
MYRYSSRNRFNYVMKSHRLRPLLLIFLALLAVFMIFWLSGAGKLNMADFENQRNAKLRNEMQYATNQTNSLSRLGATSTSGALGRIRQYVHGMEVINDLNVSVYGEGGRLYEQRIFHKIYDIIDSYDAKLNSGLKVNDSLAELNAAMGELSELTNVILGY